MINAGEFVNVKIRLLQSSNGVRSSPKGMKWGRGQDKDREQEQEQELKMRSGCGPEHRKQRQPLGKLPLRIRNAISILCIQYTL